jgi:hypothetical protein
MFTDLTQAQASGQIDVRFKVVTISGDINARASPESLTAPPLSWTQLIMDHDQHRQTKVCYREARMETELMLTARFHSYFCRSVIGHSHYGNLVVYEVGNPTEQGLKK